MAIQITAARLSAGTSHEHISHLWWTNPGDNTTGDNTRAQIVTFLEDDGKAYVEDASRHGVNVGASRRPTGRSTCEPTPTACGWTT